MDKKLYQSTHASHDNTRFTWSAKGVIISIVLVKKELLKPQPFQNIIILICLFSGSHFVTEIILSIKIFV